MLADGVLADGVLAGDREWLVADGSSDSVLDTAGGSSDFMHGIGKVPQSQAARKDEIHSLYYSELVNHAGPVAMCT